MRWFAMSVALVTVLGCESPTAANNARIVGSWRSTVPHMPTGYFQSTLVFSGNGSSDVLSAIYGAYPGQGKDDLSSYSRTRGTYTLEGDSLRIHTDEHEWWDRFYGDNSPVHVERKPDYGNPYSGAVQVLVSGDRLTMNFYTYPADAPVATTAVYERVR